MTAGELRRGLLITQTQVAERTGLAHAVVQRIEDTPILSLDVNTLDLYVTALGGRLEAVIPAPGGTERRVRL
jgi:hypothetical protein